MGKELDVRALMMNKLKSEYFVENCKSFKNLDDSTEIIYLNNMNLNGINKSNNSFFNQLVFRNFNKEMWWSKSRQSAFIESVFMGCEIPLIVVLEISKNPIKYLVVDGLNRILTINNFLNDNLKIIPNSIKKAKFLENQIFSNLEEDAQNYFENRGMQILKYSYVGDKTLSLEEIEEIAKQIYLRYNSGIQLKNEEIQKADYEDDYVTKEILKKINNENGFLNKLTSIFFSPQKESKTFVESTLMYSRFAITSCYAPIHLFCRQKSILNKIDVFYKDYTMEVNKDNIVNEFNDIVVCLYELTKQEYWKEYVKLHNQYFMMVTYWLIFYLKKYNLIELKNFNWKHYISYFGKNEEINPLFSIYHINSIIRYNAIISYVNDTYGIDLNKYLTKENKNLNINKVDKFSKLPKYNFLIARNGITISSLINQLKENSFILRPSYQRREINDIKASSFLIESLILNMTIPDILVYKYENECNKTIFEVIDGQQRCFTFLAMLKEKYTNFLGEQIASEKEGFSLKGLDICQDLNGKKIDAIKKEFRLDELYKEKILNGKIRIVYIPDKDNPYFSVKDYFTSINKTIIPLKKTSFRYWNVNCDSKLMKKASEIAKRYQGIVLPKFDNNYTPQQSVVNLAYLFYFRKNISNSFSVQQVTCWLNDFNQKKYELINKLKEDEVDKIRDSYSNAFDLVDTFLAKIQNWLDSENKEIIDLTSKKKKRISFTDLLCLYYLLDDIEYSDLLNNSKKIYNIVYDFFKNCADNNLKMKEKLEHIKKQKELLNINAERTMDYQMFKNKITKLINN